MSLPDYWMVLALLYLGGVLYGALANFGNEKDFPMTRAERRDMWFSVWTWPLTLPYYLLSDDDEE